MCVYLPIYLVAVPPSIVDSHSSNDLVVREKELVNLTCEAQGYPQPQILWRREDGRAIMASGMARDKGDQLGWRILSSCCNIWFYANTGVCKCGRFPTSLKVAILVE